MWGKVLKVTGLVAVGVLDIMLSTDDSDDQDQLDMLDDGTGNINADGESMTRQEAKDRQALGELYDTYY